jgi:long-subunit fatty acid transport protein
MKLPLERLPALICVVWASLYGGVSIQATVIPVAPEPVGSGARALGQSAFIAVADDATAASWNPAGLTQLRKQEASFVGAWKSVTSDPSSVSDDESYNEQEWSDWQVNFMSYAQPLPIDSANIVLSANYHQVYDLGVRLDSIGTMQRRRRGRSEGAISAYSLAGGLSIPWHPEIAVGVGFNWYTRSLARGDVRQVEQITTKSDGSISTHITETLDDLRGYNFTLGLLWNAYEKEERLLTFGAVCHTPFTAEVEQEAIFTRPPAPSEPPDTDRLDIDFPLSLGAGVNYRFCDEFSGALDVQWTEWSQFQYTDTMGKTSGDTRKDTMGVRLGIEYLDLDKGYPDSVWAYRAGAFCEPRPAWDDTLDIYGFSVGIGWTLKEQFSVDFAYQYRWGDDEITVSGADLDYHVEEHLLVGSWISYF